MAAVRISSALVSSLASTSSSPIHPSTFTKLRSAPSWPLSFTVTPLCSRRAKRMAHSIARATLGLTHPNLVDAPKISFAAKEIDLVEWKGDILAVGATEKDLARDEKSKFRNPTLQKLDSQLGGLLSEASSEEDFSGKSGQSTILRVPGLGSKRIALVGLGQSISSAAAYRSLGEAAAAAAKSALASNVGIALASTDGLSVETKLTSASAIATGAVLGIFEDNRFKSESKKLSLKSLDILGLGSGPEIEKKLKYAEDVCAGVIFGRELVNAPANVLTPAVLAEEAKRIASTYSDVISVKILDVDQCKELKMGSYLAVAAASANPPHFIHLSYKPINGEVKKKLALVGKGLTFDSGGYNIKTGPGCSIELMKFDMGGSAAVLGAAKALGQIKPAGVEVHFIVAACENMISGTGMRPGDIVTASNGKTIEVNNTDAEGRLTLADALVYACNQGVEKASLGKGNLCRKWGGKIQTYTFRVLQNYNIHGRFLRIEAWLGDRRNAIIIPENGYNWGWSDIANKIKKYLGNSFNPRFMLACKQAKSYMEAAKITQWPEGGSQKAFAGADKIEVSQDAEGDNTKFLSKCLIGKFNDTFHQSPNPEVIQKWFLNKWKVTAGLKVTPLNHNLFLYEFPLRHEAIRVKVGDWYWNGRYLTLVWWSPESGSVLYNKREEHVGVKAFGIPLHSWSIDTFRAIGNHCGGFVDIDEDAKFRNHLLWARICVKSSNPDLPRQFDLVVGDWRYDISIVADAHVKLQKIKVTRSTGDSALLEHRFWSRK